MDNQRMQRVIQAMDSADLDVLICHLPQNVLMLSGYWPMIGWTFIAFPRDGSPICITPRSEENEAQADLQGVDLVTFKYGVLSAGSPDESVAAALKDIASGKGWKRVGWEAEFKTYTPPWNAANPTTLAGTAQQILSQTFGDDALVDASDILTDLAARKTDIEIDKIRITNEISTFGLQAFFDSVDVGVTGVELVAGVEHVIMTRGTGYKGAKRVRAFAQVSTGPQETSIAYRPMVISTTRPMESGDIAMLELAVVADGFWCDRTRTRVAGKPSDHQIEIHTWDLDAQLTAINTVRAGIKAHLIDEAARSLIKNAGYSDMFNHPTGHGVGFGYHDAIPQISPKSDQVLEAGMIHSLEPGIYSPEAGGIREEDNVVVSETGCEVLGPFSKELF